MPSSCCKGKVKKSGTEIEFTYQEDKCGGKDKRRYIYLVCNPSKVGCLYSHINGEGPIDVNEKRYHKDAAGYYNGLAQLIADNYNPAAAAPWIPSVEYRGITYSIHSDYPKPHEP